MADDQITIESPDTLNVDEIACLQSLSFAEIYSRETIIEPALQHTGSWLLESKDFDDWSQRNRLDEHQGFFWIQGNPGSGKSTLMKKAYSHIKACSQDPSTVLAAFFFNARGSEIEKSPRGLFRTLLHKFCQYISALRDIVVRAYVAKRRFSNFDVQWQLSELKNFLAAVVTSSILGRRKLILIVDALDECDLGAIQSVVQTFEDLARAALSEGTNFNICLSSRYWPQIRIPKCFVARVELKNHGDIVMYIQNRLASAHIKQQDLALFDILKVEILNKAQGIFLWVVLVVQDLLHANIVGATLKELRDIIWRTPPDLGHFYQHQLQSTEGEDRERMLRLFQVVFYARRPLSPTELRYALALGSGAYASYAEWAQSSEHIKSDEQMEKRVREHSKGLVEFAQSHRGGEQAPKSSDYFFQHSAQPGNVVLQFVHQSVRDFLTADGFSILNDTQWSSHSANGHEFMKTTCLNYLRAKEFDSTHIDARKAPWAHIPQMTTLAAHNPFLQYAVYNIFSHALQAEKHGISQNGFRAYLCGNTEAYFERWRCLHDMLWDNWDRPYQGVGARPIHSFAEYGLLSKEIAEKEANIDIAGGKHKSALATACSQGHEHTVELLLALGADPTRTGSSVDDRGIMHAFVEAIKNQHLPILRRLLNDRRSSLTLADRLSFVELLQEDSSPNLTAILDVLFPEATFPDSAIQDVCSIAEDCTPRVLSFLLGKSKESILREEQLWCNIVSSRRETRTSKLRNLLDRGGTIKVTGDLIRRCCWEPVETILLLLSGNCKVEMTEDLMDAISFLEDSSQALSAFEFAGYRFDAFTRKQLSQVLKHGSGESAAFFLQRNNYDVSTGGMLIPALGNKNHCLQVSRLLLGYLNPDAITEQVIIAALKNLRDGGDLVRLLFSRRSGLIFSEAVLAIAIRLHEPDVVQYILENFECVNIPNQFLAGSFSDYPRDNAAAIIDILLRHDPDIQVRESTVIKVIRHSWSPRSILTMFCKHNKSFFRTEGVIKAAVGAVDSGILEIILQQDRSTKISSSMITMAIKSLCGETKLSMMLDHDPTLVIEEKHLIAAASSGDNLIFELLQTRGKLDIANPADESLSTAKRRKVSQKPPLRISTRVLKAAFANTEEPAQDPLLQLFQKWGIITENDYANRMSNPYPSSSSHLKRHLPTSSKMVL